MRSCLFHTLILNCFTIHVANTFKVVVLDDHTGIGMVLDDQTGIELVPDDHTGIDAPLVD